MMFLRVRLSGFWFFASVISPAELEQLDANLAKAIDGYGGGTYAPTATLEIGGLATTLNATTLTLSATAMNVSAPGTWTAAQVANAGWTYNAAIIVNASVTIGAAGSLTTNAAAASTFNGAVTLAGAITQSGKLTKSGSGGRTRRRYGTINPASVSVTLDVTNDIWWVTGPTSNPTTYTLDDVVVVPEQGEEIEVQIDGLVIPASVDIKRVGGVTICSVAPAAGYAHMRFGYYGGKWKYIEGDSDGTITVSSP